MLQVSLFCWDSLKESIENIRQCCSHIRIMIQPYQDFQDLITSAINSRLWKLLITDSTIDLKEE